MPSHDKLGSDEKAWVLSCPLWLFGERWESCDLPQDLLLWIVGPRTQPLTMHRLETHGSSAQVWTGSAMLLRSKRHIVSALAEDRWHWVYVFVIFSVQLNSLWTFDASYNITLHPRLALRMHPDKALQNGMCHRPQILSSAWNPLKYWRWWHWRYWEVKLLRRRRSHQAIPADSGGLFCENLRWSNNFSFSAPQDLCCQVCPSDWYIGEHFPASRLLRSSRMCRTDPTLCCGRTCEIRNIMK